MSSDMESFTAQLQSSKRILALLGAGLSASSGLPTFRGAGGLWRTHDAISLATPEAFGRDPALVWQFYSYRRHMALKAKPNRAHLALAELARKHPGFIALSQNVDGLSQRAKHPADKLQLLHGSLFNVKCTSFYCSYHAENFVDPIVPALSIPRDESDPTTKEARHAVTQSHKEVDIADAQVHLPAVQVSDLPKCPECHQGLLRPGVVWFGESLPSKVLNTVDSFINDSTKIDLILVIGTSASVYPAAGYVDEARAKGARVAVINADRADEPAGGLTDNDWFFEGDAAQIVPDILKPIIGEVEQPTDAL
ncbi:SIR2 family histone deacetylase [Aureobasidium sp. EXF-10727]|nr:SIR2 family histone deacetylase [Aureobasidium sp. EXF-10727]KAI4731256.1 SIR2 family histone deacetylase [Aureobasidium sp. EXF-10728]